MGKLPKLSEMEHVTSKDFGIKMSHIMDRVLAEDIGIIIDDETKSYVLCPANWFEIPEAEHLETMIKNAVRYTAMLDESDIAATADMVHEFLPVLTNACIASLLDAIEHRNTDMQSDQWQEMKAFLEKTLTTTEKED